MSAPSTVTELGAIAYRLDALANRFFDEYGIDAARPLWGLVDDIVAYGLAHPDGAG